MTLDDIIIAGGQIINPAQDKIGDMYKYYAPAVSLDQYRTMMEENPSYIEEDFKAMKQLQLEQGRNEMKLNGVKYIEGLMKQYDNAY